MDLLAPLFAFGALAAGLPVLFHLIRRSPRHRVPFSTLMFLKQSPPRVTKRSRLENIFLLLLRCLALCLIAFAFARPYLRQAVAMDIGSERNQVVAVLVDRSASMKRGELWADAISEMEKTLATLESGDSAAVFVFDDSLDQLVSFERWDDSPSEARTASAVALLSDTEPSWRSTSLGSALVGVADQLESYSISKGSQRPLDRRLVLITDLQRGAELGDLQMHKWPETVRVSLRLLGVPKKNNASLTATAQTENTDPPSLRVHVANVEDSLNDSFELQWSSGEQSAIKVHIPPGKSKIVSVPYAATSDQQLLLVGDDHDFDNRIFTIPPERSEQTILVLTDDQKNDTRGSFYYLYRAFPPTRSRAVNVLLHDEVIRDEQRPDLVVVTKRLQPSVVESVKKYVERGNSVLFALESEQVAIGLGLLFGVDGLAASSEKARDYFMMQDVDFSHPLFRPFADPRFNDFTKIHFFNHVKLDDVSLLDGRILARFDDESPALLALPMGTGNVFVLAAGWAPADSDLALSSKFVPILNGILDFGNATLHSADFVVGALVPLPEWAQTNCAVSLPDESIRQLKDQTTFQMADQPGVYEVTHEDKRYRFAVNLDPSEAMTDALEQEQLEDEGVLFDAKVDLQTERALEEKQRQLLSTELEGKQKLWRWLIVTAIAVLIGETWLAGRIGKKIEGVQT